MSQSCTFVTAFYQVRDVPQQGNMMERGALLLACNIHLVVYCSPEDYAEFRAQREKHGLLDKTEFVVRAFEQIPFYKHREQIERNREVYWPTRNARAPTDVHIICMSKFEFVREVAERNPFGTTHVGWVDFRLLGEHCKPQELLAVASAPRPRFTVTVMNCWTPNDYADLRTFYAQYRYIVCGGMWTADVVSAQNMLPRLIAHAERVTLAGYGHGEEAIFAFAIDEQPEAFTLTLGDYQNITGNYFGVVHNYGYCRWVFDMWRSRAPARAAQLARDARLFLTPQSQAYRAGLSALVPTLPAQPRRIAVVVILNLAHPFDKFYTAWEEYARWTERRYEGIRIYFAMSTEGCDVDTLERYRLPSGADVFFDPATPLRIMSVVSENYRHALVVKTWNTFEYVLESWRPHYILRTNACSIWNWERFTSKLDHVFGANSAYQGPCYAGIRGTHREAGEAIQFVSGAGFLCSWDVAQTLIGTERIDAIDDVYVAQVLAQRGVRATQEFVAQRGDVTAEEDLANALSSMYHLRFHSTDRAKDIALFRKSSTEWRREDTEDHLVQVVGAGGHARTVLDALSHQKRTLLQVLDSAPRESLRVGEQLYQVYAFDPYALKRAHPVHIAVGDNHARANNAILLQRLGIPLQTIIHRTAVVSSASHISAGALILASAVVEANVHIGRGTIVNAGAVIAHDCNIAAYAHIAPGAVLCGRCEVGEYALLGAAAVVLPTRAVCAHAIVGAGAVVTKDVREQVVYGRPARVNKVQRATQSNREQLNMQAAPSTCENVLSYLENDSAREALSLVERIAKDMHGKTFHHHIFVLYQLRTLLGAELKVYAEIGTFNGGSLSMMLQHPMATELISIDPLHLQGDQAAIVRANVAKYNTQQREVTLTMARSDDAALLERFRKRGPFVDLFFIDGDHSFAAVTSDFWSVQHHVRPGGFLVFDDYEDARYSPQVKLAVDAIVKVIEQEGLPWEIIGCAQNAHAAHPTYMEKLNCFVLRRKEPQAPRFGICMATYRRANGKTPFYLERCLASIVAQSYSDWHVYLVGDRYEEPEELERIVRAHLREDQVTLLNLEVARERDALPRGAALWRIAGSNAMNHALELALEADCDYVLHLDDDDWWAPQRLERLADAARVFPDALFMHNYSTHPSNTLPRTRVEEMRYDNLAIEAQNAVHSSFCMHRIFAKGFRYASYPLDPPPDDLKCGDIQLIEYTNDYMRGKPFAHSLFVPELLTFKDVEGEIMK